MKIIINTLDLDELSQRAQIEAVQNYILMYQFEETKPGTGTKIVRDGCRPFHVSCNKVKSKTSGVIIYRFSTWLAV